MRQVTPELAGYLMVSADPVMYRTVGGNPVGPGVITMTHVDDIGQHQVAVSLKDGPTVWVDTTLVSAYRVSCGELWMGDDGIVWCPSTATGWAYHAETEERYPACARHSTEG